MSRPARVLGAVLAGGASSRFGSNKAAAPWRGEPLATHAAAALAPFCDAVVRVGDGTVADLPRRGLGPLGGIAGALAHAQAHGFDTVLTIACDMPRVPGVLIEALLRRAPAHCPDAPVLGHWPAALAAGLVERLNQAVAAADDRFFPPHAGPDPAFGAPQAQTLAAVAEPMVRDQARRGGNEPRQHRDGALSVRGWAKDVRALPIASPVRLANVNTPADLLALG